MRVVLDANVLISALWPRSVCRNVMELAREEHDLVSSDAVLDHFRRALTGKLGFAAAMAEEAVAAAGRDVQVVKPRRLPKNACRDPDDVVVLGTALAGRARVIVTGR